MYISTLISCTAIVESLELFEILDCNKLISLLLLVVVLFSSSSSSSFITYFGHISPTKTYVRKTSGRVHRPYHFDITQMPSANIICKYCLPSVGYISLYLFIGRLQLVTAIGTSVYRDRNWSQNHLNASIQLLDRLLCGYW